MTIRILAVAAAMMLGSAALAQGTAAPGASAPTPSASGANPAGTATAMPNGLNGSPDMSSTGATGAVPPGQPGSRPAGTPPPYSVPNRPAAPSGDDGGTAGKTNPD